MRVSRSGWFDIELTLDFWSASMEFLIVGKILSLGLNVKKEWQDLGFWYPAR